MAKEKFIQAAIQHPGALTAAAKAKDMTVKQFCAQGKDKLSATNQKRCNLAKTLEKVRPRKGK